MTSDFSVRNHVLNSAAVRTFDVWSLISNVTTKLGSLLGECQAKRHNEATDCYAQVAKSPNDHQGADIRCKSKRVFITKLELGLPQLPTQRLRRGAPSFGLHCLYREYSGKRVTKGVFRLKDYWLVTLFYRVVCGFPIGFFISTVNHYFQGKSQK